MATHFPCSQSRDRSVVSIVPARSDRILAGATVILLLTVAVSIARGRAEWGAVPSLVWLHLGTICVALALTPFMLARTRGDRWHRRLGWAWGVAMMVSALLSFGVRLSNHGAFSFIHLLSGLVVVMVPVIVWTARTHRVRQHRTRARAIVIGALLVAGFFTFPFQRLLGHWLFG